MDIYDETNNKTILEKYGEKAFKINTGPSSNLVYISFTNYLNQKVPYAISIDDDKKSVIISCRGTLSFGDLITDANIQPYSLKDIGNEIGMDLSNNYVHSGFFKVASTIYQDIVESEVLSHLFRSYGTNKEYHKSKKLLLDNFELPAIKNLLTKDLKNLPDVSNYKLVILGHSLGAGVASILSLLLKPTYNHIRCIAYSCPGCVFDLELANKTKEWIITPFLGKDLVVRANFQNLKLLRIQLLESIRKAKVDKLTIMKSLVKNTHADDLM